MSYNSKIPALKLKVKQRFAYYPKYLLNLIMQNLLQKTKRELKIKKYSPQTKKTYLRLLEKYFVHKKQNLKKFHEKKSKFFSLLFFRIQFNLNLFHKFSHRIISQKCFLNFGHFRKIIFFNFF